MQLNENLHPSLLKKWLPLFVCNHIVFSHVVAMTNYLLPSPPMHLFIYLFNLVYRPSAVMAM
jgi:hypothetical protein